MLNSINLSERLQTVASFLPQGANFADIGSDHAYLPCYVCLKDVKASAIAGEVNEGPFNSANETVKQFGLEDKVEVRLGDGLQVIKKDEVDQVVIAGMGGALIRSILEDGKEKLECVETIIAQPNVDESSVRKWFMANHYEIVEETILEENGHIYEIIVGRLVEQPKQLSEKELLFGPILLQHKTEEFFLKWKSEREKRSRVINQLKTAKSDQQEKLNHFNKELKWIEEVLADEE
ncbi:tRNA (adenine(22)-N(1))-methyltransferase [Ornithinibacillus halophilus]|uniref:tRNA (Adenine22-N1)-methyltransferase n=1 Tax=Ornithinibacillus halophilus TaxID=930117 RepID=A0A1M5DP01_9BACI|nr:class I SAM-dependent methyltransferase [Ornithinibacillus halophilus]SHF68601.1 tRNA (adenine22-N1)-methyltransferase [Ornithinibacillus halophilus]